MPKPQQISLLQVLQVGSAQQALLLFWYKFGELAAAAAVPKVLVFVELAVAVVLVVIPQQL
jgi:hypothetical protein